MARIRRIVRKLGQVEDQGFDAQFWPVVVALCVLTSFVLGAVLTLFRGPMLWFSLMLMPAGLAASIIILASINHRRVRRTLQLAIILSMIVHIMFILSAYRVEVFDRWLSQSHTRTQSREQRVVELPVEIEQEQPWEQVNVTETPEPEVVEREREPEQVDPTPERPQPTPVENPTEQVDPNRVERTNPERTSPQFNQQQSQMSRNQTDQQVSTSTNADAIASNDSSQSASANEASDNRVERSDTSTPVERATTETPERVEITQSQPNRNESANESSATPEPQTEVTRQENPRPTAQVDLPTQAIVEHIPRNDSPNQTNESTQEQITEANPRPRRVETVPDPSITPRVDSPELPADRSNNIAQTEQPRSNRQERSTELPNSAPTPTDVANTPNRSDLDPSQPNTLPTQTQVEFDATQQSVAENATQQSEPTPTNNPAIQRQSNESTNPARQSLDPTPTDSIAVRPSNPRNDQATREPISNNNNDVARAEQPSNRARTDTNVTPNSQSQAVDIEQDSASVQSNALATNPSSANVTRQPTQDPSTDAQRNALTEPSTGLTQSIPRVSPNANSDSTQPSVETNQQADLQRRSLNTNDIAQTNTQAESPTNSPTTDGNQLTVSPPQEFAMNRASEGTTGIGQSRNLDNDVAASERPAISPSNSVQRSETTSSEPGQAFQPSQPSQQRHSVAGDIVPSSNLTVDATDGIGIAASDETGSVNAQASATTVESRSPAATDDISALRGSSDIDVGPPKIVANESDGRGAGGGQPNPTAENSDSQQDRRDLGSLENSIVANTDADIPAAPREDGSTGAIEAIENPNANSLARSREGNVDPISGGPTNAEITGPTDLTSEAPDVSPDSLTRNNSGDAIIDATEPGGGELDEEDEEERERRRRLAQSGGLESGQLAIETQVQLPSGVQGDQVAEVDGATGSLEAGEVDATRVSSSDGSTGDVDRVTSADGDTGSTGDVSEISLARGEVSDGIEGMSAPGGGTESNRRSAPAPSISGDVDIDSLVSSDPGTDDAGADTGLEAGETEAVRVAGTADGILRSTIGAMTTQVFGPSIVALPPVVMGPSGQTREPGTGESTGDEANAGGLARSGTATGPNTSTQVDMSLDGDPGTGAGTEGDTGVGNSLGPGDASDIASSRQSTDGGVNVDIAADDGPGGLGLDVTPQVGIDDRRARTDDAPIQAFADSRFIRDDAGGDPTFNPNVSLPTDAFRNRQPTGGGRGSPQTEEAIELGLAFLARHQQPEGHWKLDTFGSGVGDENDETPVFKSDAAATGLALLAFQGAGYNHKEYQYAALLDRSIQWLVDHQGDDGGLYVTSDEESNKYARLYTHGIAALALCEAYGMTQDPELREPAQRALDYIVATQDQTRGGWRYTPGRSSDTSVSGWMMMALKSGELAGLEVPDSTYGLINSWLNAAQVRDEPHQYVYNPYAENTPERRHGREASRSMTAVALLMRLYSGWDRSRDDLKDGSEYMLEQLPSDSTSLLRDTYYWYYATQVLRHMGGDYWQRWNEKLHPLLISSQIKTPRRLEADPLAGRDEIVEDNSLVGSWAPLDPVPDAWGITGGRIYVTTLNLLSLEVDYRLMPLYADTVE